MSLMLLSGKNEIYKDSTLMWSLWEQLRETWLQLSYERSYSNHTRLSYRKATDLWFSFLEERDIFPWQCSTAHVRAWQIALRESGLSANTINQRLACVSSYYDFVIKEIHLVNGIEYSAFMDASGKPRLNPFRVGNLRREKITLYGKANPLSVDDLQRLFVYLEDRSHTVTGSRNLALILTYFLTAARNSEIVRLRWGDIRPNRSQPGNYVYDWHGKGNQSKSSVFPNIAYSAIQEYLRKAGRWEPQRNDYIWTPIVIHGCKNLTSFNLATRNQQPISSKNCVRILHTALRKAGVADWKKYRVHDLRHTFSHLFDGDIQELQTILHHKNLATTMIYRFSLDDPKDTYSDGIWRKVMLRE